MSAARTLPVTPAERACATVLRALETWHDTPSPFTDEDVDAFLAKLELLKKWSQDLREAGYFDPKLNLTPAGAALLARVGAAPERTPAAVLFAMARAYGDAETAARVLDYGRSVYRSAVYHDCRDELVRELAKIEHRGGEPVFFGKYAADLTADYAARLAGTTPIDAPPAKEPR